MITFKTFLNTELRICNRLTVLSLNKTQDLSKVYDQVKQIITEIRESGSSLFEGARLRTEFRTW